MPKLLPKGSELAHERGIGDHRGLSVTGSSRTVLTQCALGATGHARDQPALVARPADGNLGRTAGAATDGDGLPLRHFLLRGKIGVPEWRTYARAAVGVMVWLGPPLLLARLLGRCRRRRWLHGVERGWARGMARHLGMQLEIGGLEHIRSGESYVITPLHEGFVDALALLHLPLDLRFVARDELFDWLFFGPVLRDTKQVKICPEQGTTSYLHLRRQAPSILASGESLVVFPQGSILGIEIDFKTGPFALALALDRPILPIALTGSHRVWEHPFTPRLRFGQRVSLQVLPPVHPAAYRAASADALRAAVQRQLKVRALGGAMAAPRRFVPARDGYWDGFAYSIDPAFSAVREDVARHRASIGTASC